jgi:Zn-dependent protease with chaperone function
VPRRRWWGVIASAWLCVGCAMPVSKLPALPTNEIAVEQRKEQIDQLRAYYAAVARVDDIGFHIRASNRPFCKNVAAQIGLHAATGRSLPRQYQSYTHEALRISWTKPTVISVASGSPAAVAGIKIGDQILTLDNQVMPAIGTARRMSKWLRRNGTKPVQIMVRRDGVDTLRTVYPVAACAIPIRYVSDQTANAYTDDEKIVIYSGILRVARSDADLAMIIGHELAHVTMGHYGKKVQNALLGAVGGALIDGGFMLGGVYTGTTFTRHFEKVGARAFSVEFEREADYVGAYYAARAGYDISGTEDVWRRLAQENPKSIRLISDHPITPVRFVQMQKVIAEISEKKRLGLPLLPNLKIAHGAPAAQDMQY